jgi:hypothetical protein
MAELQPFRNSAFSFFSSDTSSVRNYGELNYTYPETQNLPKDADGRKEDMIKTIMRLYGPPASPTTNTVTALFSPSTTADGPGPGAVNAAPPEYTTEWMARVRVQQFSLGQSFEVFLFLDEPPNRASEWYSARNLAGSVPIFTNSLPDQCENCRMNIDAFAEGVTTLTSSLNSRSTPGSGLNMNDNSSVEAYLRANLKVGVQKVGVLPGSSRA